MNTLYYGDNLLILREFLAESLSASLWFWSYAGQALGDAHRQQGLL